MSDFIAKMHKIRFPLGLHPRPRWGSLHRARQTPQPTSKSRAGGEGAEGKGKGRGMEEKEKEGEKGRSQAR